jgi:hypothetical protein
MSAVFRTRRWRPRSRSPKCIIYWSDDDGILFGKFGNNFGMHKGSKSVRVDPTAAATICSSDRVHCEAIHPQAP